MTKNQMNQLRNSYAADICCVCGIANCSNPIGFDTYTGMTLKDINIHTDTRELLDMPDEEDFIIDEGATDDE